MSVMNHANYHRSASTASTPSVSGSAIHFGAHSQRGFGSTTAGAVANLPHQAGLGMHIRPGSALDWRGLGRASSGGVPPLLTGTPNDRMMNAPPPCGVGGGALRGLLLPCWSSCMRLSDGAASVQRHGSRHALLPQPPQHCGGMPHSLYSTKGHVPREREEDDDEW